MTDKTKNGIKLAFPLVIQLVVIVGGGLAFYFQTVGTLRADIKDSKHEVIRKVDKTEIKVEGVKDDVEELKLEQKVMKDEILDAVDLDVDHEMLKHKVKCHNKNSTKCNSS